MLIRFASLLLVLLISGCSLLSPKPRLVDSDSQQQPVPPELAEAYNQGLALMGEEKYQDAQTHWLAIGEKWPVYPGIWVNLALTQYHTKQFADGLASIQKAQQINAEFCPAFKVQALLQRENGEFSAAEKTYLQAAACDPQDAMIPFNLGILYDLYLQDLNNALVQYQRAQELMGSPDDKLSVWIADLQRRQTAQVAGEG